MILDAIKSIALEKALHREALFLTVIFVERVANAENEQWTTSSTSSFNSRH
jgi:hypothetical protein